MRGAERDCRRSRDFGPGIFAGLVFNKYRTVIHVSDGALSEALREYFGILSAVCEILLTAAFLMY